MVRKIELNKKNIFLLMLLQIYFPVLIYFFFWFSGISKLILIISCLISGIMLIKKLNEILIEDFISIKLYEMLTVILLCGGIAYFCGPWGVLYKGEIEAPLLSRLTMLIDNEWPVIKNNLYSAKPSIFLLLPAFVGKLLGELAFAKLFMFIQMTFILSASTFIITDFMFQKIKITISYVKILFSLLFFCIPIIPFSFLVNTFDSTYGINWLSQAAAFRYTSLHYVISNIEGIIYKPDWIFPILIILLLICIYQSGSPLIILGIFAMYYDPFSALLLMFFIYKKCNILNILKENIINIIPAFCILPPIFLYYISSKSYYNEIHFTNMRAWWVQNIILIIEFTCILIYLWGEKKRIIIKWIILVWSLWNFQYVFNIYFFDSIAVPIMWLAEFKILEKILMLLENKKENYIKLLYFLIYYTVGLLVPIFIMLSSIKTTIAAENDVRIYNYYEYDYMLEEGTAFTSTFIK